MSKILGVIAEDDSDVEVLTEIFTKYMIRNTFTVKKFVGNGCGKVRQKCDIWTQLLFKRGCNHVFILHDLDKNNEVKLRKLLEKKVPPIKNPNSLIVIPTQELEAWLLSDTFAIKEVFSLPKTPKKITYCETVASPKEHLTDMVWKTGRKRYVNTIHNKKISEKTSLINLQRCPSFNVLNLYMLDNVCL